MAQSKDDKPVQPVVEQEVTKQPVTENPVEDTGTTESATTDIPNAETEVTEQPVTETQAEETGTTEPDATGVQAVDVKPVETERAAAKKVADQNDVKVIYKNTKGEYFTNENYALASVGGKKENVITYDFSK